MNREEPKVQSDTLASIREKYIIKAKQLYTASSSSSIVWLSTDESDFNEDQTSDKCLVWIGFKDEMIALYKELDQDHAMLSERYISKFRDINKETMVKIHQITTKDIAQTMFWTIENFICSIIVKLK